MAAKQAKSSVPHGLKLPGRRLWDAVLADYDLEEHERMVLLQAAQTADLVADLQAAIETLGVDCAGRELAEIRQQRLAFARLVAALRLPSALEDEEPAGSSKRSQRRPLRGVYSLGGGA